MAMPKIGPYQLLKRIAVGGMGEVFLAQQLGLHFNRKVALKRILPQFAEDQRLVARFIDEARMMTQLHHGNILSVYELNQDQNGLYIVMPYLPSIDLRSLMKKLKARQENMPILLVLWVLAQICDGLDYAHHKQDENG